MTTIPSARTTASAANAPQHSGNERLGALRGRMDAAVSALELAAAHAGAGPSAPSAKPPPDRADIDAAIDVVDAAIAMLQRGAGVSRSADHG